MANLIPMDQAAAMLGMTVETLTDLRSRNEIFGYRDGQNWKFKMSELERVANDLDIQLKDAGAVASNDLSNEELEFDLSDSSVGSLDLEVEDLGLSDSSIGSLDLEDGDLGLSDSSIDSLDLSDEDLGFDLSDSSVEIPSPEVPSAVLPPTVVGTGKADEMSLLADSNEFSLEDSSDELSLEDSAELLLSDGSDVLGSDDVLDDEDDLSFGSSDISLAASSLDLPASPSDTDALLAGGSNLLDDEVVGGTAPSDTGMMLAAADSLDDDDDDDLFGDDLELLDDDSFEESADLSSDFEDSDLVLDDSDSSSEILLAGGESGINLSNNASGIELDEEPLELGGSDIDSLELPEDDDDLLELDEVIEPSSMIQEDEFKLTALEEDLDDQSSGSQVIALEDSAIYNDEGEASILAGEDLAAQPAMLPGSDIYGAEGGSIFDQAGMAPEASAGMVAGGMVAGGAMAAGVPTLPEAPFTIWQVIGLGVVATLLVMGGMLGYDIARNLWMAEDQVISSGLLKFFLEITGMDKLG